MTPAYTSDTIYHDSILFTMNIASCDALCVANPSSALSRLISKLMVTVYRCPYRPPAARAIFISTRAFHVHDPPRPNGHLGQPYWKHYTLHCVGTFKWLLAIRSQILNTLVLDCFSGNVFFFLWELKLFSNEMTFLCFVFFSKEKIRIAIIIT